MWHLTWQVTWHPTWRVTWHEYMCRMIPTMNKKQPATKKIQSAISDLPEERSLIKSI
ncbi:hypothetical protein HanRHA438_Chr03g0142941 [Helianthus annuus]|nr:hypothetical protein HanRHA438_Chr03g0142941 [Helianthus annuus]